jgi:hypothetical protein
VSRDLRELVGDDVPEEELQKLQRAHELLVAAGPPPELPPALAEAPAEELRREPTFLPPRRLGAALVLAAALLLAAFGVGYLVGNRGGGNQFGAVLAVAMHGTGTAPAALASLQLGARDTSGNWPLRMRVTGLRPLPQGGWYELYLTRHGKLRASCGTFNVHSGTTVVRLNAPYQLKRFDGWVVTAHLPGRRDSNRPLLTT